MPRLRDILTSATIGVPEDVPDIAVRAAVYDSRAVQPGDIFVAVPGFHVDGHAYAAAAVAAGAVAVIAEHALDPAPATAVPIIHVADARDALAHLAAAIAGHPSRRLTVAGITGTDGKTTTTTMLWAAWRGAGIAAASTTTVDFRVGPVITENTTRQTTREAVELQNQLAEIAGAGCTHVALETSSHSLELHRVDGVEFRAAVYTRITSEHLDLHGSREAYLAAKARLLDLVGARADGVAVLDADDGFAYPVLRAKSVANRLTYSAAGAASADLRATAISADASGVRFRADTPWGSADVGLQLAGRFNVNNALAALAAACATGAAFDAAVGGLAELDRVGGRMERVGMGQPFAVVIDYAHTSDALAKVLTELRAATPGRLWVVFGSAGDRDREKRPVMGSVAARLADIAVVTDEDPREEDRLSIIDEIAAGAIAGGGRVGDTVHLIADREAAIDYVIARALPGDTVLLAGKGHESCIIVGRESVAYSERATAEAAIRRHWAV